MKQKVENVTLSEIVTTQGKLKYDYLQHARRLMTKSTDIPSSVSAFTFWFCGFDLFSSLQHQSIPGSNIAISRTFYYM